MGDSTGYNARKGEVSTLESERIRAEAVIFWEEDIVMWVDDARYIQQVKQCTERDTQTLLEGLEFIHMF